MAVEAVDDDVGVDFAKPSEVVASLQQLENGICFCSIEHSLNAE